MDRSQTDVDPDTLSITMPARERSAPTGSKSRPSSCILTVACWLVMVLSIGCPTVSWAHGLGGAALDILVYQADQPRAVRLTTGLAIARNDRWFYVCNALWEGIDQPPMAATGEFPIWVAGADRAYTVDAFGAVRETNVEGVNAATTLRLASQPDAVWALTQDGPDNTALWRLDASGQGVVVRTFDKAWSSLTTTPEHVIVAGAVGGALRVEVLAQDGSRLRETTVGDRDGGLITVHGVGTQVLIRVNDGFENTWFRLDDNGAVPILANAPSLEGPGGSPSTLLFASERALMQLSNGQLEQLADDPPIDCLTYQAGFSVGCAVPDLVHVSTQGIGARVFETAWVEPPILDEVDDEHRIECQLDWVHFAGEASLPVEPSAPPPPRERVEDVAERAGDDTSSDTSPEVSSPERGSTDCACRVRVRPKSRAQSRVWPMLFLLLALALGRREC